MNLQVEHGVIGQPESLNWGYGADGFPMLAIVVGGVCVKVRMSVAEAKDHGASACYIAIAAQLRAPPADANVQAASSLLGVDGLPLQVRR